MQKKTPALAKRTRVLIKLAMPAKELALFCQLFFLLHGFLVKELDAAAGPSSMQALAPSSELSALHRAIPIISNIWNSNLLTAYQVPVTWHKTTLKGCRLSRWPAHLHTLYRLTVAYTEMHDWSVE